MLKKSNEIKVLLYGKPSPRGDRVKILSSQLQEPKYCVSHINYGSYNAKSRKKLLEFKKAFKRFFKLKFYIKAASSDIIYLLPMNNKSIRSAVRAAKLFGKKLVVEMYVSSYSTLIDLELAKADSREAKTCKKQDILALTKADCIIYTANHELNQWEEVLNIKVDRSKVYIAPNFQTTSLTLKRKFREDGILRICWWGTFIPLHGLDNILQAMKILKEQGLPFSCTLLGVDRPPFYTYAKKIELNNLEQHVFLRKDLSFADDSLPNYLIDNCDLALGIFGHSDKARHAFPNKLSEALSMKIPTLTMNSPALSEFFDPEVDLWTCEPSPESIAKSILAIASRAAYPVNWEQTQQKALDTFSVARYQEVLSKVLGGVKNDCVGE